MQRELGVRKKEKYKKWAWNWCNSGSNINEDVIFSENIICAHLILMTNSEEKNSGRGNDRARDGYQSGEHWRAAVDLPRLSSSGAERWTISYGSVALSVHICPSVMQRCAPPQHTELTQTHFQRSESYDHMRHSDTQPAYKVCSMWAHCSWDTTILNRQINGELNCILICKWSGIGILFYIPCYLYFRSHLTSI